MHVLKKNNLVLCFLFVFCVLFASGRMVQAQEKSGVFGSSATNTKEGPFEFEFDGGVKVAFESLQQHPSETSRFIVYFNVITKEDIVFIISRKGCVAFDNAGNQHSIAGFGALGIANFRSEYGDPLQRMIIEGIPTKVYFQFDKGKHEITEFYPRIDVNIMGKVVTMRNVFSAK